METKLKHQIKRDLPVIILCIILLLASLYNLNIVGNKLEERDSYWETYIDNNCIDLTDTTPKINEPPTFKIKPINEATP